MQPRAVVTPAVSRLVHDGAFTLAEGAAEVASPARRQWPAKALGSKLHVTLDHNHDPFPGVALH